MVESTFSAISGIILGALKHYFGHKMRSFVVVADALNNLCGGLISVVSLVVSKKLFRRRISVPSAYLL